MKLYPQLPRGATYTRVQSELAGVPTSTVAPRNMMDAVHRADRLLQDLVCVGGLACCATCTVGGTDVICPIAVERTNYVVDTVLAQPVALGPTERRVLASHLDRHPAAEIS